MIDRVVLVLLHQSHEVGKFERRDTPRLKHDRDATHEVVEVRHLRQHIVTDHQIGSLAIGGYLPRGLASEELHQRRHTFFHGHLGNIGGRLDAQSGNSFVDEVLQQIAVIARQFDGQALPAETETFRNHVHVV